MRVRMKSNKMSKLNRESCQLILISELLSCTDFSSRLSSSTTVNDQLDAFLSAASLATDHDTQQAATDRKIPVSSVRSLP